MSNAAKPAPASPIAALRGSRWLTVRLAWMLSILMIVAGVAAYLRWLLGTTHGYDPQTMKPIAGDFTSFWVAARSALAASPRISYDLHHAADMQIAALAYPPGVPVPIVEWLYPPTFLLVVIPFGLLPLTASFSVWIVITTGLFVYVVRRIAGEQRSWLPQIAALGFSGVQDNLHYGQNGAMTAAMLGLGLWFLPRRPILAGICFGALTCKPQLFLLLPLALLAGRYYRAMLSAAVSTAVLVGLSVLAFGPDIWGAFFDTLSWAQDAHLAHGELAWERMPTLYATLRMRGLASDPAYIGQGLMILASAVLVWQVWRRPDLPYAIKAAACVYATVASAPYLLIYDLTLLGIGIVWLARDGVARGFQPWAPILLVLAWYAGTISDYAAPMAVPFVPLLCLTTLMVLRRA